MRLECEILQRPNAAGGIRTGFVIFFCLRATFWRSDVERVPLEEEDEEDDDADEALILCFGDGWLGEGGGSFITFKGS